MSHHRFFDSDSDEDMEVHPPPSPGKTGTACTGAGGKQPLSAKWPRVLIRYDSNRT